jgi:hypothetical protein
MPYRDIKIKRENGAKAWLKWAKEHPIEARERFSNQYYRYYDFNKKHHRVQENCYSHNLPVPHKGIEDWDGKIVKVSREANGRFITWIEFKEVEIWD